MRSALLVVTAWALLYGSAQAERTWHIPGQPPAKTKLQPKPNQGLRLSLRRRRQRIDTGRDNRREHYAGRSHVYSIGNLWAGRAWPTVSPPNRVRGGNGGALNELDRAILNLGRASRRLNDIK